MNFIKTFLDAITLGIGLTFGYYLANTIVGTGAIILLKVIFE